MPLLEASQVGPASLDVRLGTQFRVLRRLDDAGIDPGDSTQSDLEAGQELETIAFGDKIWLHPGQFLLGSTLEFLRFPADLGGYVVGRSSWGRVGLLVATAIMIQPGFSGCLTLELVNHGEGPIALYAGSRIAQIAVHSLSSETDQPYDGKYIGPTGPQVSRLSSDRMDVSRLERVRGALAGESTQEAN